VSIQTPLQRILLMRHAETAWSLIGQHTGATDLPLTEAGRHKVALTEQRLAGRRFTRVLTSPLTRAAETSQLTAFGDQAEVHEDLHEWDYGSYEGLTTPEIRDRAPGWELDREGGHTLLFSHGHLLRALAVRWIGMPPTVGRLLELGTGSISTLGWKRELKVMETWNDRAHLASA
jgi:probable phosphoglycerate mutase